MTSLPFYAIVAALFVSGLAPVVIRPFLVRLNVLDVPNERSSHSEPVLRGAGIAPLLGFLIGMSVLITTSRTDTVQVLVIGLSGGVAGVLGLVEDLRGVRIAVRASVQLIIGAAATSILVWSSNAEVWWIPMGALVFTGYTNAANFMDGINGISGLHGAVVGSIFAVVGAIFDLSWLVGAGLVLAVAFLAFLPWNLTRKGMFLGDVGSYLLGGAIGILAIAAVLDGAPAIAVVAPLGIYLADTSATLVRRVRHGEAWQQAHRSHVYQRLTDAGFSHLFVAVIVTVSTAALSVFGLLSLSGSGAEFAIGAGGILSILVLYLSLPRLLTAKTGQEELQINDLPSCEQATSAGQSQLRWAIVGGTGFIGSALIEGLRHQGIDAISVTAPRLRLNPSATSAEALIQLHEKSQAVEALAAEMEGMDVVVNAAGLASPGAARSEALFGANALLPAAVLRSAQLAHVRRVVHLSSAAVQGRREVLDEAVETSPFSPYSESKAFGEAVLLAATTAPHYPQSSEIVIVRATSVQGAGRATTGSLRRLAQSRAASVASPGNRPTVVSSLQGLVEFVASVGAFPGEIPAIVLQPWEGMTTTTVLEVAGGRMPMQLPVSFCRASIAVGYAVGTIVLPVKGLVRRVEVMWFGQEQDAAWAKSVGLEKNSYVADVFAGATESVL